MKKMKTKLFTAVAMLAVSAITLSTASYAWFTMQKTATVNEFSLTATAPTSIQIANTHTPEEANWKSVVDMSVTTPGKLIPVSSANGFTMYDSTDKTKEGPFTAATGAFKAVTTPVVTTNVDGYYLDIPLSFRTLGNEAVTNLYLDTKNSTIIIGEGTKGVYKATRISFLKHDATDISVTGAKNIWAPLTNGALATTGLNAASGVDTVAAQNIFTTNTAVVPALAAGSGSAAGTPTKIIVRVWIEGQDSMCKSLNAGGALNIKLAFKDTVDA